MSSDPLSDPLSGFASTSPELKPTLTNSSSSWAQPTARHDLFAQPFESDMWSSAGVHEQRSEAEEQPAAPEAAEAASEEPNDEAVAEQEEEEEAPFTYPEPAASAPRSSTLKLNAEAKPFTFPFASPTAPITMPRTASSLSRERSPSTSGIREGQEGSLGHPLQYGASVTPRDASPFAHFSASEAPSSPDLSSTPSATTPHHRLSQSRKTNTAAGSVGANGYDPAVLKSLITDACITGDLYRLQALLNGGDGSDEAPSVFTLANRTLTSSGLTPLHLAAGRGHVEVVEWLAEKAGAMMELEDAEGETPLHKASHRGHLNVCRFLVEAGVAVDVADGDGWTPLHNAASRGWLDIARLLVEAGAQVDLRSKHGYTALMNGASKGQLPIVHFLTKRGADPLLRNAWGETAYDLAAAVFEINICTVLAQYEASVWTTLEGTPRPSYNPLFLHSTHPVVLHENARLARPTLKKLSSLGTLAAGQAPRWSSKALSRNDNRTAFTMPTIPGLHNDDSSIHPVFRSEVGLPIIGKEAELILPEQREVRSAGRPGRGRGKVGSVAEGKRPQAGSRRSSATSSLTAVLASTSGDSTPLASLGEPSNSVSAAHGEAAWFWLSDWCVDLTDPSSSPVDGWSYATSFDAPAEEWLSEPPADLQRVLEGDSGMSLGGQKWVRRRRWVRVMRRRLDISSWGFGEAHEGEESVNPNDSRPTDTLLSPAAAPATEDYRARAQFLAGIHAPAASSSSDRASIRSGKTVLAEGEEEPELDRAELRKAAARLERAADELRAGILSDENAETRRKAEGELEAFLHQLALIRTELGPEDEEDDSDDEFIYSGRDADPDDDDARSAFTTVTNRPDSITSRQSSRSVGGGSTSDYFSQPTSTAPTTSSYPDLTPQLSQAPDFRVPTHETSQIHHSRAVKVGGSSPSSSRPATAAVWEADELANECRRCQRKFTFFNRKHHCRRCGQIVCNSCSTHTHRLDPSIVVHEPGTHPTEDSWDSLRYRTCDTCHAALSLPAGLVTSSASTPGGSASVLTAGAFFPASPSLGSASPSEAGASDVSDLTECPVCGIHLGGLGGREEQEEHVKDCLETGGGSIVQGGRYLVFKLPPGPLVSEECRICFEEFVVNDKLARLLCLCYFHQGCIKSWLDRGKSCPFHASRDVLP